MRDDPYRHLGYSSEAICPLCGDWLRTDELHTCPDLNPEPRGIPRWLEETMRIIGAAIILAAFVYFLAHGLVAMGVGCP